jgi:diguanylate cyclase (GGDEF)-like protein
MPKPFVLIVEDERDIAALFRHLMDMAGYRTEIAANGTLALERLSNVQPDMVLLDLSLPRTSGDVVLQQMRADERLREIPVIVITAHYELAKELVVEPDLLLLKPVSSQQLIALVDRLRRDRLHVEPAPLDGVVMDEVTGLYNRSFFLYRLDSALRSMQENGQGLFAVLSITPDRYEDILEHAGQNPADDFLHSTAASLKACVRPTDTIARFEADRFFILIEQAPGLRIPDMIAARIQNRINFGPAASSSDGAACNIGILLCDKRYEDAAAILRDSRAACQLALAAGSGACLTFDHDSIDSSAAVI